MADRLDFETFKRSRKPNNHLVAPEGHCGASTADEVSPTFDMPANALFTACLGYAKQAGWRISSHDEADRYLHAIATTRLLRFKDDVHISAIDVSDETSQIAVYSASRVGHSDLGKNKSRVQALLAALQESSS